MPSAPSTRRFLVPTLVAAIAVLPALAWAHPGHGTALRNVTPAGFLEGLLHPLTGLDHLLVLLAAGLIASRLPREQRLGLCGAAGLAFVTGAALAEIFQARSSSALELVAVLAVAAAAALVAIAPNVQRGHNIALVGFALGVHGWVHGADLQLAPASLGGMAIASAVAISVALLVGDAIASRLPGWASARSGQ